jgi:hypothetical protein
MFGRMKPGSAFRQIQTDAPLETIPQVQKLEIQDELAQVIVPEQPKTNAAAILTDSTIRPRQNTQSGDPNC